MKTNSSREMFTTDGQTEAEMNTSSVQIFKRLPNNEIGIMTGPVFRLGVNGL